MKTYVADLDGQSDPHVVERPDPRGPEEPETVLFVPVPRRVTTQELDSELKALHSQWFQAAQMVVLRLHPPHAAALLSDRASVAALDRRLEGRPAMVAHLGPSRAIELTPLGDAPPKRFDQERLIENLRAAELDSWLKRPGVVFPANSDFHYEGPNGCHYESFMRVGTAMQGSDTLDAIAFWLQPYLGGERVVVLDAWTIISVALNLDRYARLSGPPCESVVDVECLGAYDEDPEKLRLRLAGVLDRCAEKRPSALLVSSVISMGNLHRQLEDLITAAGFDQLDSVALYGGAETSGTVFCRPHEVGRYWQPHEECPLRTPAVPIAAGTYLVEASIEPAQERIKGVHAEKAWEFFDRYKGGDFLSVHRDEDDGERHHLIHVDVQRLARHPAFVASLDAKLGDLAGAGIDLVLTPRQPAAVELAEKARERLGAELVIADEAELGDLPGDVGEKLRGAERILLVDDLVITGTRLLSYRDLLRRGRYISPENPSEVHLLAGIERVDDYGRLRGIVDMVDDPRRFHAVESLLLPDWGEAECPWCWELRQLEEYGHELELTEELKRRWDRLRARRQGLKGELFIPWVSESADTLPVSAWDLGNDSVFHAESQLELFVAVASAVQVIRAAGDLTEQSRYPLSKVLDPSCWLGGRYYDSVIAAAILRATRRHDLRATQIESKLRGHISNRLKISDLRGELIMTAARGHLPSAPDLAADGEVFNDPRADPGFVGLMRRALHGPDYAVAQ